MASQLDLEQLADVLALMAAALRSQIQPVTGGRQKSPPGDGAPKPALRTSANDERHPVVINAARFVTIEICAAITGLTRSAINKRMDWGATGLRTDNGAALKTGASGLTCKRWSGGCRGCRSPHRMLRSSAAHPYKVSLCPGLQRVRSEQKKPRSTRKGDLLVLPSVVFV